MTPIRKDHDLRNASARRKRRGHGQASHEELVDLCHSIGYADAGTCIQSGNVVLRSDEAATEMRVRLEQALTSRMRRPAEVIVLEAAEMRQILEQNPFSDAPPSRVVVIFTRETVGRDSFRGLSGPDGEEVASGAGVVHVH